ncbi:MAG: Ig-like domain-containing protein, partial [Clostridia bacterium]|nr:Ig-like domain-containing protein [Clostridia bacterium]
MELKYDAIYYSMEEVVKQVPYMIDVAVDAIKACGVEPEIIVSFSEKVYRTSSKGTLTSAYCEDYAFELRKGSKTGTEVPFTATVASTYKKVTITPDEMLEPDAKYYIVLNKKLYDGDGDLIPADSSYFNTEGGLAVTISPENAATNISTTPEIVVEFSETVLNYNGKALTNEEAADAFEIRKATKTGDAIGFTAEVVTGSKKIILTPDDELEVGKKYYVILLRETLVGKESKEENEEIYSYFTVASASAPMITPADGKKNVGVDTQIEISFADKLYAAYAITDKGIAAKDELTSENIADYVDGKEVVKLRKKSASGSPVSCDIDISADGRTIILTPTSSLAVNYDYYVVVKASTLYVGTGTKKNSAASTAFSTNEALMPTFEPEDGDKNIEVDAPLKITFDESIYNSEGDELTKNDVVNDVVKLYKKSNNEEVDFGAKVSGRVITITPIEDLEGGTEYVLAINSGSVTNNSGITNQSYSITFKTESKVVKTVTF